MNSMMSGVMSSPTATASAGTMAAMVTTAAVATTLR